jgi:uncharacterized membrane protein
MISNHYASTYGHAFNWLILAVISVGGVGVRHYFNVRHREKHNRWVLPVSLLILAVAVAATMPAIQSTRTEPTGEGQTPAVPTTADILPVITERCTNCHSAKPAFTGFAAAPMGVELDTAEQIEAQAPRVFQATVVTRTMPLGNMTGMTAQERDSIARWYAGRLQGNE